MLLEAQILMFITFISINTDHEILLT